MSDTLQIASRKGLFTLERSGGWHVARVDFLGDNCSAVLSDTGSGAVYAALDHGHFGTKLHRAPELGAAFEEITPPRYPEKADDEEEWTDIHGRVVPHNLELIWCLEAGHRSASGSIWCGTVPGGLFHSGDGGDSWQLVESLWNDPLRRGWFGGGMDYPGIDSICVHPDDPATLAVAVSCGGVWHTRNGGESWRCRGRAPRGRGHRVVRSADKGRTAHTGGWTRRRAAHRRWRQELRASHRGLATGTRLRYLFSTRPGRGRQRRAAGSWQHHGLALDLREWWRSLGLRLQPLTTDLRVAFCAVAVGITT